MCNYNLKTFPQKRLDKFENYVIIAYINIANSKVITLSGRTIFKILLSLLTTVFRSIYSILGVFTQKVMARYENTSTFIEV